MIKTFVLFLITSLAFFQAQDVLYQVKDRVLTTQGYPYLIIIPQTELKNVKIEIKGGGKIHIVKRFSRLPRGAKKKITIKQPAGVFDLTVKFKAKTGSKKLINQTFKIKTVRMTPMEIYLNKKDVDIDNSTIKFSAKREVFKVDYKVLDKSGNVIDEDSLTFDNPKKSNIVFNFNKGDSEVGMIVFKAYDRWGFWAEMELKPFTIFIPHQDVVFDFGKWDIKKEEEPKLIDSLKKIKDALKKYGKDIELKLYIAGYTDTVGSKESNLKLSENRALAIAKYFRKAGLKIPIYYQGFGEEVLFKVTPDETPEEKNRRALYILSTHSPEKSSAIPRSNWKRLK